MIERASQIANEARGRKNEKINVKNKYNYVQLIDSFFAV